MIIQTEKERVLTSLSNKERQFTISSSPKAFAVLMEGLYSNKILAIVRELTSNAYDAHVQAGLIKPFEITAPTVLAPTFQIRDFGESMNHDFVMRLYSSVFFSSKEDTNDQVGTFGLGSKSPFAYADVFNLSTYLDGVERLYSCFLNPERIPCIVMLAENATDKPDGTLVSFDVSAKDIKDFENAIRQVTMAYWRHPPVVRNLTIKNRSPRRLDNIDVDEIFVYALTANSGPKYFFSQGNVWYPVPNEFIVKTTQTYTHLNIFDLPYTSNLAVVMEVPVGTFNVTPSRESISLDKFSIENINKYITALQNKVIAKVKDVYAPCKTRLDYFRTYRKLRGCGIATRLIEHKYNSPLATGATVLSSNILRIQHDGYFNTKSNLWKKMPKNDLKLSELKPGFLYMPGYKANTWNIVTAVGGSVYFDWNKVRLFSGVERKLVRKATRLKHAMNRGYAQRETEYLCFTEDLPRFVRILGLKPEQVFSVAAIDDPGPPASSKKTTTTTTTPATPKHVWKPGDAFVVVVQHGYVSSRDPFCATHYQNGTMKERISSGDIQNFCAYLLRNMTDAEKKIIIPTNLKVVNWESYDGDDTFHIYNRIVKPLGEDKLIEIMLRAYDLFSVDVPLEYKTTGWNQTHPFRPFVVDVLNAEGHVTNQSANGYSPTALAKCPFADIRTKAMELADKKQVELKAQKQAILDQYPMFQVRNREQLLHYLEELKCSTTSSTSSVPTPSPTTIP